MMVFFLCHLDLGWIIPNFPISSAIFYFRTQLSYEDSATAPVTQPRQLVPKMHIRPSSEKVDGCFCWFKTLEVLSFLMQQNLCVKSQEVWRTNIFFRGLRWKPACKLIETDSPDFKDKQKLRFVFFCLPHWPHGNCLLICCMPKWGYTIQAWWIITFFVLRFA